MSSPTNKTTDSTVTAEWRLTRPESSKTIEPKNCAEIVSVGLDIPKGPEPFIRLVNFERQASARNIMLPELQQRHHVMEKR